MNRYNYNHNIHNQNSITPNVILSPPRLDQRQARLLILDLDGTIMERLAIHGYSNSSSILLPEENIKRNLLQEANDCEKQGCPAPKISNERQMITFVAPKTQEFIQLLRQDNISIGVWSCAQSKNVYAACEHIFGAHYQDLLECILTSQDCEMDPARASHVTWPTFKNLRRLWALPNMKRWNATNTLALDDNPEKFGHYAASHVISVSKFIHSHPPTLINRLPILLPTIQSRFQQLRNGGMIKTSDVLNTWLSKSQDLASQFSSNILPSSSFHSSLISSLNSNSIIKQKKEEEKKKEEEEENITSEEDNNEEEEEEEEDINYEKDNKDEEEEDQNQVEEIISRNKEEKMNDQSKLFKRITSVSYVPPKKNSTLKRVQKCHNLLEQFKLNEEEIIETSEDDDDYSDNSTNST